MIQRSDILSIEYLKKNEFTGCHQGMRYRLEKLEEEDGKKLKVTVWPEPFNFQKTPAEQKISDIFSFDEDGLTDGVAWMNDQYFEQKDRWTESLNNRFV